MEINEIRPAGAEAYPDIETGKTALEEAGILTLKMSEEYNYDRKNKPVPHY